MNLGQSFAMGNHHKIFWKRKTVQPGRINDYFDVSRIRFAVFLFGLGPLIGQTNSMFT
jgi:hypothetical protein